ncbi:MAG: flagellar hook capping FlgD N-terminal domain-containing protein [Acidimicrobiales bacterium]
MSFIVPTSGSTASQSGSSSSATAAASTASGLNQLDNTQTFLNLLVAQLKNQDPSNPTNPTSFMTEIAQLTAVQSQTTLNAEEQTVAADSMLGQKISGTDSGGQTVSGTVTSVLLNSSGPPQLTLAGQTGSIALDQVTQVSSASAAAASTGAVATGTASTGTASTGATSSNTSPPSNANGNSTSAAG